MPAEPPGPIGPGLPAPMVMFTLSLILVAKSGPDSLQMATSIGPSLLDQAGTLRKRGIFGSLNEARRSSQVTRVTVTLRTSDPGRRVSPAPWVGTRCTCIPIRGPGSLVPEIVWTLRSRVRRARFWVLFIAHSHCTFPVTAWKCTAGNAGTDRTVLAIAFMGVKAQEERAGADPGHRAGAQGGATLAVDRDRRLTGAIERGRRIRIVVDDVEVAAFR